MFKIETVTVNAQQYLNHPDYEFEAPARAAILHMISCQGNYEYIGNGAFGTVYGSPKSGIVYKFGEYTSNRGYLSFVKEMSKLKKHNPFLPLIHGVRIYNAGKGHRKFFVVAMERLESDGWNSPGFDVAMSVVVKLIRQDNTASDPMPLNFMGLQFKENDALFEAVNVVKSAHRAAQRPRNSVSYDLHSGNFMMRDRNQLVVIDPLA